MWETYADGAAGFSIILLYAFIVLKCVWTQN